MNYEEARRKRVYDKQESDLKHKTEEPKATYQEQ